MKKDSFLKGAFLMVVSASLVKIGGALFKIPLASLLTGSGMGLFMAAYSIFTPYFSMFASGLSPAVSSYVSKVWALKGERETEEVCKVNLLFFLFYSLAVYFLFVKTAPFFCRLAGNEDLVNCIYSIAPCMFFCTLSSVIKGSFEGRMTMLPTAFSNLLEVFSKFFFALLFARSCLSGILREFYSLGSVKGERVSNLGTALAKAVPEAASHAFKGIAAAGTVSCVFLLLCFIKSLKNKRFAPRKQYFRAPFEIIRFSIPVCISSLIISLYPVIDMYTFMKLMKILCSSDGSAVQMFSFVFSFGIAQEELPSFLYGCYSAVALTLFHLVPSVSSSLSIAVLPMVSSLYAKGNTGKTETAVEGIIRFAAFICFPMGMAMFFMPREILLFFFSKSRAEAEAAVPFLIILGPAAVFAAMVSPVFASLQGTGQERVPAKILFSFLWLKLGLNVLLTFLGKAAPLASAFSTLITYIFIFICSLQKLSYKFNRRFSFFGIIKRPFAISVCSCIFAKWIFNTLSQTPQNPLILVFSALLGALMYILLMFFTGEFKQEYIKILYCNKNA